MHSKSLVHVSQGLTATLIHLFACNNKNVLFATQSSYYNIYFLLKIIFEVAKTMMYTYIFCTIAYGFNIANKHYLDF